MTIFSTSLVWLAIQVTLFCLVSAVVYIIARRFGPRFGALVASASLLIVGTLGLCALSPWPNWVPPLVVAQEVESSEPKSSELDQSALESSNRQPLPADNPSDTPASVASATGYPQATTPKESQPTVNPSGAFQTLIASLWQELNTPPTASTTWTWRELLGIVLLTGIVLGLIRTLAGLIAVRSHCRRSRRIADATLLDTVDILRAELHCSREVTLHESAALPTAATVGWRRPMILLPTQWRQWSSVQLRAVLAHELAHISQNDFLSRVIAQLGVTLNFYHPLVHWLSRRQRLEQELSADATAAESVGGSSPYLTALAELALKQPNIRLGWPAQTFLPTRGMFLRRIEMLRNNKGQSSRQTSGPLAGLTQCTVMCVLLFAGLATAGLRGNAQEAVTESISVSEEAKADPQPVTWEFGKVVECVVNDDNPALGNFCIDFDKQEIVSIPATVEDLEAKDKFKWVQESGIDAAGEMKAVFRGLIGFEMVVVPVDKSSWENGPKRLLLQLENCKPGTPALMSGQGELPVSYLIQTREGGRGILQITGFVESTTANVRARGVSIRYKMLKPSEEKAASPANVPYTKATLPDVDQKDINTMFDLSSGKFQKNSMQIDDPDSFSRFSKLGKGDLWWDQVLGTVRGVTVQQWDGKSATYLKPGRELNSTRNYPTIVIPTRLLVTTAEGNTFDVKLIAETADGGLEIEYRPTNVAYAKTTPPDVDRQDAPTENPNRNNNTLEGTVPSPKQVNKFPRLIISKDRGGQISPDGITYSLDSQVIKVTQLKARLMKMLKQEPDMQLMISADPELSSTTLTLAMQLAEAAGVKDIAVSAAIAQVAPRSAIPSIDVIIKVAELKLEGGRVGGQNLPDLWEAVPPGSVSYEMRKEVVLVYRELGGDVFFVPSKNVFYIQRDPVGSSTMTYYGPFQGDPRKLFTATKRD
jgi:beta-lactamase regulating signal transducer with metallopeptidase domain/biopolymer transport protein ExbD